MRGELAGARCVVRRVVDGRLVRWRAEDGLTVALTLVGFKSSERRHDGGNVIALRGAGRQIDGLLLWR